MSPSTPSQEPASAPPQPGGAPSRAVVLPPNHISPLMPPGIPLPEAQWCLTSIPGLGQFWIYLDFGLPPRQPRAVAGVRNVTRGPR